MVDSNITNTTLNALGPVATPINTFFQALSLLVGGIFGAYIIFAFFNYLKKGREVRILNQIKEELQSMNSKLDSINKKLTKKK